ncbi:MAG: hypothetical protein ACFE9Q_10845 [Candidatus Hodarchaeota archaeon]
MVEEKLDYLIIGDVIEEEKIPSPEIHAFLVKFSEHCKRNQLIIKSISFYCITSTDVDIKYLWMNFFRENNFSLSIFPPFLQLKLEKGGLTLEKNALKLVKDYSNDFIEYFINNKIGGR